MVEEQLGKRIARLRTQFGWTQQMLADRLAISRVAVSHLEMDLSLPSERTVTLLAGLFKLEPAELVAGTIYPQTKAERLPLVACRYTEMELQLILLRHDLNWLEQLDRLPNRQQLAEAARQRWRKQLDTLKTVVQDSFELELLAVARAELAKLKI